MREDNLVRRIRKIIEDYTFSQPFSIYLKEYFRDHREMGARDRREARELSFNFFRIGKNLEDHSFEKRLAVAVFLCSNNLTPLASYVLKMLPEISSDQITSDVDSKLAIVEKIYPEFSTDKIFSMHDQLSHEINKEKWNLSFLNKPLVWIRVREKHKTKVVAELNEKNILFNQDENSSILSFNNDAALNKLNSFDKGYFEIQDKSSQLTKNFFGSPVGETWWDACAGSGGKSLLLIDLNPGMKILATDNRENILINYKNRMSKAGYDKFDTRIIDLSKENISGYTFDGIIADVPCSGSGTWARSPEWLQKNLINEIENIFVPLQRKIVSNVIKSLKKDGTLIYITCSVFKKENEENIDFFLLNFPLKLEKCAYLQGYESGSDTLFIARLRMIN